MAKKQYGIIRATPPLPAIDLVKIPHKGGIMVVNYPAFGPSTYSENIKRMKEIYSHSKELPKISFREPTTLESISALAYKFGDLAKPRIFTLDWFQLGNWFQLGYIVKRPDGVFANPPKDAQGNPIIDEKILKSYLNSAEKVNGIYLLDNDFGFAPYESFRQGVQDCDTFAEGGLARLLEHADKKTAENLRTIASPKFYKNGINVCRFDDINIKEPVSRVVGLNSERNWGDDRLNVNGDYVNYSNNGLVFGVLDESTEGIQKI